jgi:hypothetical protein
MGEFEHAQTGIFEFVASDFQSTSCYFGLELHEAFLIAHVRNQPLERHLPQYRFRAGQHFPSRVTPDRHVHRYGSGSQPEARLDLLTNAALQVVDVRDLGNAHRAQAASVGDCRGKSCRAEGPPPMPS